MLKFKLIHYYGLFVVINTEIIQSNIHKELRLQRRLSGIYRLVSYTQAHSPQLYAVRCTQVSLSFPILTKCTFQKIFLKSGKISE